MTKTLKGESRDWLSPLFCWLYAAVLLWVLGLLTLGQRAMEGYYAHGFCVENWALLLAAAGTDRPVGLAAEGSAGQAAAAGFFRLECRGRGPRCIWRCSPFNA